MLKKVLINIAIIFLCILGISAEGRAEEWSEKGDHGDRFGGLLSGYVGLIIVPVAYN